MASNVIVVMAANGCPGMMSQYLEQLERGGVDYHVYPVEWDMSRGGLLKDKVAGIRRAVNDFGMRYNYIIISDCCDITFYGDAKTLEEKLHLILRDRVMWAGEKNCYPDPSLAEHNREDRPWAFPNGGLSVGTRESYLRWCDDAMVYANMDGDQIDQLTLNRMAAAKNLHVDSHTNLFFCLFGGYEELRFLDGKPCNCMYGSHPLFLHANGCWTAEEMFEKYKRSLE